MVFHYKQKKIAPTDIPALVITDQPLKFVYNYTFLGTIIDCNLTWTKHITYISDNISKVNGILSKLKYFFPTKILKMIYNSLIASRLSGLTIWSFGNCERIKTLQRKAIRNVNKSPYFAHTKPICHDLNILLFDDLVALHCLKFYYKYINDGLPVYFYDTVFIHKYTSQCKYTLRKNTPATFPEYITSDVNHRPNFLVPKTKKCMSDRRLLCHLPRFLNATTPSILCKAYTHSLEGLKSYFKNYIVAKYNVQCEIINCYACNST